MFCEKKHLKQKCTTFVKVRPYSFLHWSFKQKFRPKRFSKMEGKSGVDVTKHIEGIQIHLKQGYFTALKYFLTFYLRLYQLLKQKSQFIR